LRFLFLLLNESSSSTTSFSFLSRLVMRSAVPSGSSFSPLYFFIFFLFWKFMLDEGLGFFYF
jgi:hypothetical protein